MDEYSEYPEYAVVDDDAATVEPDGHTMFCDEYSSGWDEDGDGNMVYDCHCGKGRFPGEC